MAQNKAAVESYFDREARRFDGIYTSANKGNIQFLVDRLFRTRMLRRRNGMIANLVEIGANCLEVGSGSGRTAIELARARDATVHGLDISETILEIARDNAANAGVSDQCRFEHADFLTWQTDQSYEILVGVGLLDYFDDPLPFLQKAARIVGQGSLVISYPVSWRLLNVARRFWLMRTHGCPVRFYSHAEIDTLARHIGGKVEERHKSGGLWPIVNDAVVKIRLG